MNYLPGERLTMQTLTKNWFHWFYINKSSTQNRCQHN